MTGHDIIVIGASAGGVEALMTIANGLPANLPAAVFVVLHIPPDSPSLLPTILNRTGSLPAVHPADQTPIEPGHIYVAPPDHHLLIGEDKVLVVRGPKENRHRPAVDPLFRSAAVAYGPRVIGVVLTGSLDDGTAGLLAVKRRGGLAVVQDPNDALYYSMPRSAIDNVNVDFILPLQEIATKLVELVGQPIQADESLPVPPEMKEEVKIVKMDKQQQEAREHPGNPSPFSCPECGGVLWELQDGDLLRFRCRVGHAFSIESVQEGQSEAVENALWTALKTLEESMSLSQRLEEQARNQNKMWLANRFSERAHEAEQKADVIRKVLLKPAAVVSVDKLKNYSNLNSNGKLESGVSNNE